MLVLKTGDTVTTFEEVRLRELVLVLVLLSDIVRVGESDAKDVTEAVVVALFVNDRVMEG
jgi:hypothetical protein